MNTRRLYRRRWLSPDFEAVVEDLAVGFIAALLPATVEQFDQHRHHNATFELAS
jgi:zona occludens toxin (predicted ATPase)